MTLIELILAMSALTWLMATIIAHRSGQKTLSRTMLDRGYDFSFIPFIWGSLTGHYFIPSVPYAVDKVWILLIVMLVILIFDLIYKYSMFVYSSYPRSLRYPIIWVALGVVCGAMLWTQPI